MYTSVPRTILWLIPGGSHERLPVEGRESDGVVEVEPFYIGKFPVTNEQFEAFDPGFDRAPEATEDRDPALGVSFEEAADYCRWYAEVSRKPMRLPTELEWEYACCGGEEGVRHPSPAEVDAMAWHAGNSGSKFPKLEARQANGFGLYGMLGGAWEWVAADPLEEAAHRVARGGSWRVPLESLFPGIRRRAPAAERLPGGAFRVAKSLR